MTDAEILERALAGEVRADGSTNRVLTAEVRRLKAERDALMGVVIRPWTREGDGRKLWRVYLAWFDTTETEAEAVAMVRKAAGLGGDS